MNLRANLSSCPQGQFHGPADSLQRRSRIPLTSLTLGILLVCTLSSGCSSHGQPISLAMGQMAYSFDANGFEKLLGRLNTLSADDRIGQLRAFADSMAPDDVKQKAAYALARDLQARANPESLKEAIARYEQAKPLTPLAQLCAWHTIDCATKLGDERTVRAQLTKLAQTKDPKERARALYTIGQSYMRTGEDEEARTSFKSVSDADADSQYALGSLYYLAELDLKNANGTVSTAGGGGQEAQPAQPPADAEHLRQTAVANMKRYLRVSPDGHFALDIANQLRSQPGLEATAADHNLLANAFYSCGAYREALAEWKKANNTSDWYKQGTSLLRLGRTNEGKAVLSNGMKAHPSEEAVATAATTLCRFVNRDGAIEIWKGVLQRSPQAADVALYNLGIRASSPPAALPYYDRVVQSYPQSAYAPESAWWLAWNSIKAGNAQDALTRLQSAASRYPDAKAAPRFNYWIGKMYERLGQRAAAATAYQRAIREAPWHYYAHRSRARLAALSGGRDRGWATSPTRRVHWTEDTAAEWDFPEPPAELCAREGATLTMLTSLHQWDECLELCPESNGLLKSFYLAKLNLPLEAINAAGKAMHGTPEPGEGWQLAYPLLYARFIASEAPRKHVDPLLMQALIREESRYNTQAVSSSRALGLMQLMPGTAAGVAKRLGIRLASNADIHDAQTNMRMGIDYFSKLQERFKGNALFAVAGYNGGPNAVAAWAANMPPDIDIFVENIKFKETREYVCKVFGSYWNYELVYGQPPVTRHPTQARPGASL